MGLSENKNLRYSCRKGCNYSGKTRDRRLVEMRFIYNLLLYIIFPLLPIRLFLRSFKNSLYMKDLESRFAIYHCPKLKSSIWVHVVSLGEAISAIPLIKSLKSLYPNENIVVTTMTPTGLQRLRGVFGDEVIHLYVPYDYPHMVKRFLNHFNPILFIVIETEIWPNILHYTKNKNIPILLANARLSPVSFEKYLRIKFFIKNALNCIDCVMAQSIKDGERFLALGLSPEKLTVIGNIKFDMSFPSDVKSEAENIAGDCGLDVRRPIWIAASTHDGEEEKVLIAARKILMELKNTVLILVPRHPERFDKVFNLCKKQGFKVVRYSENRVCDENTEIILGDVMGKLLQFYSLSDVAFVGGSLVPIGGHNILEPAYCGVPILTGNYLENFLDITKLFFDSNAAIKVHNEDELAENVLKVFLDEKLRISMTSSANKIVDENKGALQKVLSYVEKNHE